MRLSRGRSTSSRSACGRWATPAAIRSASPSAPVLSPVEIVAAARRGRRLWRELPRQRPRAHRRHAGRPRPHRRGLQEGAGGDRARGARWRPRTSSAIRSSRTARSPRTTPRVRAYALQKTMRAIDLGVELGAKMYVFWGGREGAETDAAKDPHGRHQALPRRAQLPVRVRQGSEVRPASSRWRPSPTSRAATSTCRRPGAMLGLHRDAGAPRDGRREPRGRPRAHGRAELHPRASRRRWRRASSSTST